QATGPCSPDRPPCGAAAPGPPATAGSPRMRRVRALVDELGERHLPCRLTLVAPCTFERAIQRRTSSTAAGETAALDALGVPAARAVAVRPPRMAVGSAPPELEDLRRLRHDAVPLVDSPCCHCRAARRAGARGRRCSACRQSGSAKGPAL